MSYIVNATTYADPVFDLIDMDLTDLQTIYETKIQNYLSARETAKEYYDWAEENVSYTESVYDASTIASVICYNKAKTDSILSCMPLFIYLTCYTKDWTKKYTEEEFTEIITDYKNMLSTTYFDDYMTDQDLDNYIGLRKWVEDNTPTSDEDKTELSLSSDASFLTQFSAFWKNSCSLTIIYPTKAKSLYTVSTISKEDFFKEETSTEEEEAES